MANEYKLSYTATQIDQKLGKIDNLATKNEVPSKTSDLTNDSGFITGYTETDPTVPAWAKAANKPTYTASEVGADVSGTASNLINTHNTDTTAHSDIRNQINQISSDITNIIPVRGADYWTEEDKALIIAEVVDSIKVEYPEAHVIYGDVDENNIITIYGELAEGTYTLKYENTDGTVTEIGTIEVSDGNESTYTNQIPISTDTDGSVYNTTGYKTASRISSGGGISAVSNTLASNPAFVTGFIPCVKDNIIRLANCFIDTDGTGDDSNYYGQDIGGLRVAVYNSSKTFLTAAAWNEYASSGLLKNYTVDSNGYITEFSINNANCAFVRLCLGGDPAKAIVTINEEITD